MQRRRGPAPTDFMRRAPTGICSTVAHAVHALPLPIDPPSDQPTQPRTHTPSAPHRPGCPGWLSTSHSPNPEGGNRRRRPTQPAMRNNPRHTVASAHTTSCFRSYNTPPTVTLTTQTQLTAPSGHPGSTGRKLHSALMRWVCSGGVENCERPTAAMRCRLRPWLVPAQTTSGTAHKRRAHRNDLPFGPAHVSIAT